MANKSVHELVWTLQALSSSVGRSCTITVQQRLHRCWPDCWVGFFSKDSEADSAASSQFEVDGYPTILLLKNNRTYIYDGERTISQIIDFATKNYVHAPAFNFTGPKTFTERFSTGVVHVFGAFAMITNALGLSFLPFWVKGTLPLLLLLSPIIGIILCIIFVPDDPIPQKKEEHEKTE
eukprot:TRINITY_DN11423_c0_g1_i19.p1 TRINITY_DN11423_c0_g1~~TRINITY_DN11423_c0_g1_i19.p1  ORF type:complete len:179 (-),score=25.76 TRINITY_DN11423_c0_g1_i19:69-605(-)